MRKRKTALAVAFLFAIGVLFFSDKKVRFEGISISRVGSMAPASNGSEIEADGASGDLDFSKNMVKVGETKRLVLHADLANSDFILTDKTNGVKYYSRPPMSHEDPIAKQQYKRDMASHLIIHYVTDLKGNESTDASATYKDKVSVEKIINGIRVYYRFTESEILVPVEYRVENDAFVAEILLDGIEENGKNSITTISLLPYFAAADNNQDGYILVPDGCGGLIHFNNSRTGKTPYSQPVYGNDPTRLFVSAQQEGETARLPVFGIKFSDHALFAVVENGETAMINASTSGINTSYNHAYVSFRYRASDQYILGNSKSSTPNYIYQKQPKYIENFKVKYFALSDKDANYSGMARRYNLYLRESEGAKKIIRPYSTILEFIGAVQVKWSIIGIPMEVKKKLTTFDQAVEMLNELLKLDMVPITLKYTGWNKQNVSMKTPASLTPLANLGGRKGFQRLLSFLDERDIPLFLTVDFIYYEKGGGGISAKRDSARLISGLPATQKSFKLSTNREDPNVPWGYYIGLASLNKLWNKAVSDYQQLPANISIHSMGNVLYSDFTDGSATRQDTVAEFRNAARKYSDIGRPLMTGGGNAYMIPFTEYITDIPVSYSGYDLIDESVPFYALALNGLASLSTPPVNRSSNPEWLILKCAESGICPQYSLFMDNIEVIKNTRYNYLYGSDYNLWKSDVEVSSKRLASLNKEIGESFIFSHEKVTEDVTVTTYENGKQVYVNFADKDYTINGFTVPSKGWLVR